MFDATKGNQKVADQVDAMSDDFAARFGALPTRQQVRLMARFNDMLDDDNSVDAFANGTYAQDSSGAPAKALGSSSSNQKITTQEALEVILNDQSGDPGIKAAFKRILIPSDPEHIPVGLDGTPAELGSTRLERDKAKAALDAIKQELKDEQDENKSGSLANQLKTEKEKKAPATPAGTVDKATLKVKAEAALAKVKDVKASPLKGGNASKAEAEAAVQALVTLAS